MNRPQHSFLAVETKFQGRYGRSLADTLLQAYRPFLIRTVFLLCIGLLGRIALLGNANLIGYWVDSLCHASRNCHPLPPLLANLESRHFLWLLAALNLIGFAFTLAFRAGVSRLSAEAVSRIYDETTFRTSRAPMSFFDQNPSGRIMTRFTSDYNNIFRIFGGPISEFLSLIFDLTAMTILIGIASPWLLPFWVLQAILNSLVYFYYLPSLRKERRELALKRSPAIAHFAESAAGANTIRAFQKEKEFERRFSDFNDSFLSQREKTVRLFSKFSFAMGIGTSVAFLATGLSSYWLASTGRISVGAVGVAFAYVALSGTVLQSFFDWLGQFEEAMTGMERMNEYLRMPIEPGSRLPAIASFSTGQPREIATSKSYSPLRALSGAGMPVEINQLCFRYKPDLDLVLKNISIKIAAGERLAVVGKTGSGKTSLVQALFHLYPFESGGIRVGGYFPKTAEDSSGINLAEFRSLISYIPQEPSLFLGTIRENLMPPRAAYLASNEDEALIEALRRVQFLHPGAKREEFLHWLNYHVEERGRNLSAGERQLLCMARCLLRPSPVVVFDEATSAVDPSTEEILTRATEDFFRGRTQIIIAHRLSTIRSCDRVLWLDSGEIFQLGKPSEILPIWEKAEIRA